MGFGLGLAWFFVAWWVVFLALLPWGVRTAEEEGESAPSGTARGAPMKTLLGIKALGATAISLVLWGLAELWFLLWG